MGLYPGSLARRAAASAAHRAHGNLGALPGLVFLPAGPKLIVFLALVGIRQDFVRLVDLLESRFRIGVAWIDVRVELTCQLAIGRPDLLLGRRFRYPQKRVIVLESTSGASENQPPGATR